MVTKLGTATALALFALTALPANAAAQSAHRVDAVAVQQLIATWPAPARQKALKMIQRNGMPDQVTQSSLIWDVGDIKRRHPKADPTIVEGSILPDSEVAEGGAD